MQTNHIIKRYDAELSKLEKRVLKMGELACTQLERVQVAIQEEKEDIAESIVEGDRPIDMLELKVDKLIINMIARRAPIGNDLRFIVAVSRMVNDIERIGDEASNMAQSLIEEKRAHRKSRDKKAYEEVSVITQLTAHLLEKALKAFDESNLSSAQEIALKDTAEKSELQRLLNSITEHTLQQKTHVGDVFNLVLAIRSLERISRHIHNIGEHVIYLITGEDIRHQH